MIELNILCVEDEPRSADNLKYSLERLGVKHSLFTVVQTILSASKELKSNCFDLVFLDIQLGNEKSFELLPIIEEQNYKPLVTFLTAYEEFALKAFRTIAADYLLKPINLADLDRVIRLAQEKKVHGTNKDLLVIPTISTMEVIDVNSIIYCKADGSYTTIFCEGKEIIASKTLKHIQNMLPEEGFARIHTSYLVNIKHILRYYKGIGGQVSMSDKSILPVSIRRKEGFLNKIMG